MAAYRRWGQHYTLGAAAITLGLSKTSYAQDTWGESNVGRFMYGSLEGFTIVCQGFLRSSRAVYTFSVNSLDYKYSLRGYDYKSEEYYKIRSQVHLRAAKRILKLCESNKGFYIKAGQFMASLQHVPKEFTSTLSTLQDKAVPCHIKAIKQVFVENFGKDIADIYVTFDEQPIASASIAQVHRATLADGQEVAVKVQYPGLQQQLRVDIRTMVILSHAISWIFPDYQFEWIVPEFEKTLSKELDFLQEAENAERTARNFKKHKEVKVPHIFWDLTTRQVLTMEFMHGCKIDDLQCLLRSGLNPKKVAQTLVEVFAEMIFVHGYVHGDPHPGNILVFPHSSKDDSFDLVLLDHGIYRELEEKFRMDFCQLWKALILLDQHEMQQMGERLGVGKYYQYLPVIFTGRTIDRMHRLRLRGISHRTRGGYFRALHSAGSSTTSDLSSLHTSSASMEEMTEQAAHPEPEMMLDNWCCPFEWFDEKGCSLGFGDHEMSLSPTPAIASHVQGNRIDNSTQTDDSMDDGSPRLDAECSTQNKNMLRALCDLIFEDQRNAEDLWFKLELMDRKLSSVIPLLSGQGYSSPSKSGLGKSMPIEERKRLSQEVRQFTMGDISQFMESLPRDLLTVLRTDGLLRSIISKLGAPQRVRLLANVKYAVAGLVPKYNSESGLSLKSTAKATFDYIYLRLYLELLELHYKMRSIYASLLQQFKYWFSKFVGYLPMRRTLPNML